MNYLGKRSRERLIGVHPDLVRVVEQAIRISEVDFTVIDGVRTIEQQIELYAKGRTTGQLWEVGIRDVEAKPNEKIVTWTLNSLHMRNARTGFGHAVDLAPFIAGKISWEWKYFPIMAKAMKIAAKELDVPVEWGGDWVSRPDGPHFQLPKNYQGHEL